MALNISKYNPWKKREFPGIQYLILIFFWLILIASLFITIFLFVETQKIISNSENYQQLVMELKNSSVEADKQEIAKELLETTNFGIIDFSLLSFSFSNLYDKLSSGSFKTEVNTVNYLDTWNQKQTDINSAYSYIFITLAISICALIFYITMFFRYNHNFIYNRVYDLHPTRFYNYSIFKNKIYLEFTTNLTIVFSFFNFLSTLIICMYGLVLLFFSSFMWFILRSKSEILLSRQWWKNANFRLFTSFLLLQNGYNFAKSLFLENWGVNLDLLLKIIWPLGTLSVVLVLLIKNMLNDSVLKIKKDILNIDERFNNFKTFYDTHSANALTDYNFFQSLPKFLKIKMRLNPVETTEFIALVHEMNNTIVLVKEHFKNNNEYKYLTYCMLEEVSDFHEIQIIKENILKIQSHRSPNPLS